jgi:hypothetical protein
MYVVRLSFLQAFVNFGSEVYTFLKCTHARPCKQMMYVCLVKAYKAGQYLNIRLYVPECHEKARIRIYGITFYFM